MWRNFRYAILGIFVVAAVIAPTPDIITMCIFAAPMIVLYISASASPTWCIPSSARSGCRQGQGASNDLLQSVRRSACPVRVPAGRPSWRPPGRRGTAVRSPYPRPGHASAAAPDPASSRGRSCAPEDFDPTPATPPAMKLSGEKALPPSRSSWPLGPRYPRQPRPRQGRAVHPRASGGRAGRAGQFNVQTAAGAFAMNNIIAKFPGKKDGIIVLAGHYDTNYPLKDTTFIGANDGGCNVGLMLEIASRLQASARGLQHLAAVHRWRGGHHEVDRCRQRLRQQATGEAW